MVRNAVQSSLSEWRHVVDASQVEDATAYAEVPRMGRRLRLGARPSGATLEQENAAGEATEPATSRS